MKRTMVWLFALGQYQNPPTDPSQFQKDDKEIPKEFGAIDEFPIARQIESNPSQRITRPEYPVFRKPKKTTLFQTVKIQSV